MIRGGGKREGAGRKKSLALAKITREISQKNWRANHQYAYIENCVFSTWRKVRAEEILVNDSNFASWQSISHTHDNCYRALTGGHTAPRVQRKKTVKTMALWHMDGHYKLVRYQPPHTYIPTFCSEVKSPCSPQRSNTIVPGLVKIYMLNTVFDRIECFQL